MRNVRSPAKAVEFLMAKRRRRAWKRVVRVLGCAVVFCTIYALILPALTLTADQVLDCQYEVHTHTPDCYDAEGNLICGYADFVVHTHDESCYDADGNLVCTLPEIQPHTHTESCFEESYVLICGQEESEGHTHTGECYQDVYDEEGNLVDRVLICGLEESEGHTHTDECYALNLTLICDQDEVILHTHDESCYDADGNLICGKLEVLEHVHDESCFVRAEAPEEPDAAGDSPERPAQNFYGWADSVNVTVSAPEGAFPAGTEMSVTCASSKAVQAAAEAVNADTSNVQAVDITFRDADGWEIEPAAPISVTLSSALVASSEEAVVVHVDDNARAEVIDDAEIVGTTAVTFEADAFSVYAIVGTGITDPRYTVEFYADNGMTGTPYETQLVKANDSLVRPEIPEILDGYTEFAGWYIGGTEGENGVWTGGSEVQFGPVTKEWLEASDTNHDGVIQIHARFIKAVYVTFYDYLPSEDEVDPGMSQPNIVTIKSTSGGPIDLTSVTAEPQSRDLIFEKWVYLTGNDVEKNVYDRFSPTEDTSLYASFVSGYSLVFDANGQGASSTPTQYLKNTKPTTKPEDPTRPGYTFAGWYTDASGGSEFTFNQTLTEDTTVYAHWTAAKVDYTVVFWQQKVSDDKNAADEAKTYNYVSSEVRQADTGSTVNATDEDIAKSYDGFHYGRADTNVTVQPDGSTILNVYYDRNLITMTFSGLPTYTYEQAGSENVITSGTYYFYNSEDDRYYWVSYDANRGWYYDNKIDYEYNIDTSKLYTRTQTSANTTFTGLYGQTLAQNGYTWPTNDNTVNWSDGSMTWTFMDAFILTPADTKSVTYTPVTATGNNIYFYKQNADGTWPDTPANTAKYRGEFSITDKYNGFTAYEYKTGNGNWTPLGDPDSKGYYETNIPTSGGLHIHYKRNTYTLDFMNGSENVTSVSLLYGAVLNTVNEPSDEDLTYPGASGDAASHYTFKGWYSAPVGGTKLDFATINETMPANNLVAYAQWEAEDLTVTFNANGGTFTDAQGAELANVQVSVDYGEKLSEAPTPQYANHNFLGWADENGHLWNFDTAVTANMTLYAQWHTDEKLKIDYYTYAVDEKGNYKVDENGNYVYETASVTDASHYKDGAIAIVKPYGTSGARFVGWSLGEFTNDYGSLYQPGDEIEVTSQTDQQDGNADNTISLYAVYSNLVYTSITFNPNGGSFNDAGLGSGENYVLPLLNNEGVDLDTIQPTYEGYKLIGWAFSANATEYDFTAGGTTAEEIAVDNVKEGEQNILYAVWEKVLDLTVVKTEAGKDNTFLEGADFVLYYTEDETNYYYDNGNWSALPDTVTLDTVKQTTGADGKVTFSGLENGTTYNLEEIKAPDGYKLLANVITFSVNDGKAVNPTGGTTSYAVSDDGATITVPNSVGTELPHTGGVGTQVYIFSGLALVLGAVMCDYSLRRKRERRQRK